MPMILLDVWWSLLGKVLRIRGQQRGTSKVDAPSVVVVHTAPGHAQDEGASLTIPREVAAEMKGNRYG
jgi:hypothetical protein